MSLPDPVAAVLSFLQSDGTAAHPAVQAALTTLHTLVDPALIRAELREPALMPRAYVTVLPAGGPGSDPYLPYTDYRLAVRSYGATPYAAQQLDLAVRAVLMPAQRTQGGFSGAGALILSVLSATGPTPLVDAAGAWPFRLSSYLVRCLDLAVTA